MAKTWTGVLLWALLACSSSDGASTEPAVVRPTAAGPEVAPDPTPTPEPPEPSTPVAPDEPAPLQTPNEVTRRGPAPMPPALDRWIAARVRQAHLGVRQFVRIPLVYRGPFGCDCPDNYVGLSPGGMDGGEFLTIENDSGQVLPDYDPQMGTVVIVDGYFGTGQKRYDGGDPSDPTFMLPFHITRIPEEQPRRRAIENVRLVLLGEARECEVQVNDPESPLNVRERPASGAHTVGTIDHGTTLHATYHRRAWTRIDAPLEGWVWTANTRVVCPAG